MTQVDSLLHLALLLTMPPVVTYATISVAVAVHQRCSTWSVALKGWGSAIMLLGYVLFNWEHGSFSAVVLALAVIMFGVALCVWPFVWDVAKRASIKA